MIKTMESCENDAIFMVADLMVAAAKTAPKGSGKDKVVAVTLTGEDKDRLSRKMKELGEEYGEEFFVRDSENVNNCPCVVIIGAISEPFGIDNCMMCGFKNCAEMQKSNANCAFNITDLGIAIGSAVSVASTHKIDNRVMYSAGKAAAQIGCLPDDVRVCYGIPLYTGSKSIFFDRNPGAVLK